MNTPEQPTVLPWHREAAHKIIEAIHPQIAAMRNNPEWEPSMYGQRFSDTCNLLALYDPQEPPLFTSRVLVPQLRAEIEQLRKQHAETVRLLEEVADALKFLRNEDNYLEPTFAPCGIATFAFDKIRTHLAQLREPATLQPATAEKKGTT